MLQCCYIWGIQGQKEIITVSGFIKAGIVSLIVPPVQLKAVLDKIKRALHKRFLL